MDSNFLVEILRKDTKTPFTKFNGADRKTYVIVEKDVPFVVKMTTKNESWRKEVFSAKLFINGKQVGGHVKTFKAFGTFFGYKTSHKERKEFVFMNPDPNSVSEGASRSYRNQEPESKTEKIEIFIYKTKKIQVLGRPQVEKLKKADDIDGMEEDFGQNDKKKIGQNILLSAGRTFRKKINKDIMHSQYDPKTNTHSKFIPCYRNEDMLESFTLFYSDCTNLMMRGLLNARNPQHHKFFPLSVLKGNSYIITKMMKSIILRKQALDDYDKRPILESHNGNIDFDPNEMSWKELKTKLLKSLGRGITLNDLNLPLISDIADMSKHLGYDQKKKTIFVKQNQHYSLNIDNGDSFYLRNKKGITIEQLRMQKQQNLEKINKCLANLKANEHIFNDLTIEENKDSESLLSSPFENKLKINDSVSDRDEKQEEFEVFEIPRSTFLGNGHMKLNTISFEKQSSTIKSPYTLASIKSPFTLDMEEEFENGRNFESPISQSERKSSSSFKFL